MKLKDIFNGVRYTFTGALTGLITGTVSSFLYILGRIYMHVPNSTPGVDISLDASQLNMSYLENCLLAQRSDCHLPVDVQIDMDNWTYPILLASTVGAGVGTVVGLGCFAHHKLQQRNARSQIIVNNDERDAKPLLSSEINSSLDL